MKSNLPAERKEFQFDQATVIYTAEHSAATGMIMPKLYVQMIDYYGYQRELSVQFRHRSGNSDDLYWEVHAYRHPGRRHIQEISKAVAERFVNRFLTVTEKYPIFLFNNASRHRGFVCLSERLLDGETCSSRMID